MQPKNEVFHERDEKTLQKYKKWERADKDK